MFVASCQVTLRLQASRSLKDKRQVVRSLGDRLRRTFNVALAEVDDQEVWQSAVLGIAAVSNSSAHAEAQLDRVIETIERTRLDAEIVDVHRDVMQL